MQNAGFLFAEEDFILNSLDALPSTNYESPSQYNSTEVQTNNPAISHEIPISNESYSLLAAQSEYMQSHSVAISNLSFPFDAEKQTDKTLMQRLENVSVNSFFGETPSVIKETFDFPAFQTSSFRVGKTSRMQKKDGLLFQKMPIDVEISAETVFANPDGKIINPKDVNVYEAETAVQDKANTYHAKKQKKTSKKSKDSAPRSEMVFEFGIPGVHLTFSKPVKISLKTPNISDGVVMDIGVLHAGDKNFNTS